MKRIEGQIRGIQRMIEEGKECEDILMQVRAARSALTSAGKQVIRRYLIKCHLDSFSDDTNRRESMEKVIDVLTSYANK